MMISCWLVAHLQIGASFFKRTELISEVIHPWIRARAPPGSRASSLGGSCGPVASLGMLIRRYLVPRGRGHTPQVVVEPFASPQRRRRPARSGAAAGGWKGGEGRELILSSGLSRRPASDSARLGLSTSSMMPLITSAASRGPTTTCGVCPRPRGTNGPAGAARARRAASRWRLALIQWWITSDDEIVFLKTDAPIFGRFRNLIL